MRTYVWPIFAFLDHEELDSEEVELSKERYERKQLQAEWRHSQFSQHLRD